MRIIGSWQNLSDIPRSGHRNVSETSGWEKGGLGQNECDPFAQSFNEIKVVHKNRNGSLVAPSAKAFTVAPGGEEPDQNFLRHQ